MRFFKIVLFLFLWLTVTPLFGQTIPMRSSLYSYWDRPASVTVNGDYLYVAANNKKVYTYHITDLANPELTSVVEAGRSNRLQVIDNILWEIGYGYAALTLENPSNPRLLSSFYPKSTNGTTVATDGHQLVVGWDASWEGRGFYFDDYTFRLLDVRNASDPLVRYDSHNDFYYPGEVLKDSILWGGPNIRQGTCLTAVSLRNPSHPNLLLESQLPIYPIGCNDSGTRLYGIDDVDGAHRICMLDVTDPTNPHVIVRYMGIDLKSDFLTSIEIQDTLLTLINRNNRFASLNVANVDNPVILIDDMVIPGARSYSFSDGVAAVVDSTGAVCLYRGDNVRDLEKIATISNQGEIVDVAVVDDIGCVLDKVRGLSIVDLSDLNHPHELGRLGLPTGTSKVAATRIDRIFVMTPDSGLFVCSAVNPNQPSIIGRVAASGQADDLLADGNYLYYVDFGDSLQILSAEQPDQPILTTLSGYTSFGKYGDLLYACDGLDAVVFDVSSPLQPVQTRNIYLPRAKDQYYSVNDLFPVGDHLYYKTYTGWAAQPGVSYAGYHLNKAVVAETDTASIVATIELVSGEGPSVDGRLLAWQDDHFVLTTSGFTELVQEQNNQFHDNFRFEGVRGVNNAIFAGRMVFLATGNALSIYDCSDFLTVPTTDAGIQPLLLSLTAYPNPFNGQVTLSYNLQRMGLVEIEVFDALGRQVATLPQGYQISGSHKLNWDANRLPSGLYNVVLNQQQNRVVQQIVLTR